jgi:hypothetical protein
MKSVLLAALLLLTASAASAQNARGAGSGQVPGEMGFFPLRLPSRFEVAPHWHTQVEHVTPISGLLHFGVGEHFNWSATRPMPAGSFGYWPIGMRHFAGRRGRPRSNCTAGGLGRSRRRTRQATLDTRASSRGHGPH